MSKEIFKKLGLDPDKLDEKDIEPILRIEPELKKMQKTSHNPESILHFLKNKGIDVKKLLKRMKVSKPQKQSVRIGRNSKCICDSGKKYKKCCGQM